MAGDHSADDATGADAADPGPLQRGWQLLQAAGQWVADTFKGHSGAHQMRDRER